ncbi:hypothetical protein GUITHDRAFT_76865 [Guillardia theta CCMP2712]|uniref:Kinesin-like protein n=1 Tax=Guillardia theta (strain CCMP2712) TaxID=905079 RepID=L1IRE4_GUITC|nr:hypothetical protein GUITHDRAFT_76865 [Guillardia theta CCMP2712]EKX38831.1 hypothetical protein GUITHDRAFT_76865 [Guillardia theta CCMP2712]|eukprot:XP_005825811.1 hypothetical protein GUITHDRAFT_76865 [Guillardia theta CCMP2712]
MQFEHKEALEALESTLSEKNDVVTIHEQTSQQLAALQKKLEEREQRVEILQAELDHLNQALSSDLRRKDEEVCEQAAALAEKAELVKELQSQLAEAEALHASSSQQLQQQLKEKVETLERLEEELAQYRSEASSNDVEFHKTKAELSALLHKWQEVEETNRTLQEERDSLKLAGEDLQGQLDAARKQLASTIDEKTSAIDELRNQLESAKSSLQHERETSNYKISDLSKDLDREVGEKRTMQVRLEAQDEKIGDMKALLAVCQSQLESRTAEVQKLEARAQQRDKEVEDLRSQLMTLESERASAQSRMQAAEEDADAQKALVTSLKEQVLDLKQKLAKAEGLRRRLHNELQELKGNIRVFARVRPSSERSVVGVDEELGTVMVPHNGQSNGFRFDRVFPAMSSQEDVFSEVSQFVQSALDGYNVSLFAYGQTGSGKTHTMFGSREDQGIIPRSMGQILGGVEGMRESGWEYQLEASFLEIYQEHVRDLLCAEEEREGKKYTITLGENGRHDVSDLIYRRVRTMEDVEEMMAEAERNKSIAKTDMNERSSRSHTVFSMRITGRKAGVGGQQQALHGTLHLVDLAGSERLAKSHATGERLKETQAINKSLSALSDVFVALSKKSPHVPYRNSKLTFLLQPCLSGDGKALLIANCSPIETSSHETLCTLRFASMVSSCELGKVSSRGGGGGGGGE